VLGVTTRAPATRSMDCESVVTFYLTVFAGTEVGRRYCASGRLVAAEVQIGDRRVALEDTPGHPDAGPGTGAGAGVSARVDGPPVVPCSDVDQLLARVLRAGAVLEIAQERTAAGPVDRVQVVDPVGRRWNVEPAGPPC